METYVLVIIAILVLAILAFRRADQILPEGRSKSWLRVALVLMVIFGLIPWAILLTRPPMPVPPPSIQISPQQAYIAEIKDLDFEVRVPESDQPLTVSSGNFIDFIHGALLQTGAGESGYVFVGLPGRAGLFLGPDSQVRLISSDSKVTTLQLEQGRLILDLPDDFAGSRVTILSAGGARAWLDASRMCLSYEPASKALRMDCVEDRCGYVDPAEQFVQAGYHVTFKGASVVESGPGLQPEACQFVPGAVPSSTATPTASPADLTPGPTATQP